MLQISQITNESIIIDEIIKNIQIGLKFICIFFNPDL